jgi:hypothetical protein
MNDTRSSLRKLLPIAIVIGFAYGIWHEIGLSPNDGGGSSAVDLTADDPLATAFKNKSSSVQVSGAGVVVRLLADDEQGSRHQRFILEMPSGQTVLVAHNIDLAPRIDALKVGDRVEFNGAYEWNDQGGVIHWTHHDPKGRHEWGWLKHTGELYR